MRKTIITLLILLTLIFTNVFILFSQENIPKQDNQSRTILEGKIIIENRILPELITPKESLKLMIPPFVIEELDIKDNDTVKVEGYKKEDYMKNRFFRTKKETIFFVTKIVAKGKEIDLEKEFKSREFYPPFERYPYGFNKSFRWGGYRCPYHW